MKNKYRHIDFKKTLNQFDPDLVQLMNEEQIALDEAYFNALKDGLKNGTCSICGKPIQFVDVDHPCFHWLINPTVKKKYLERVLHNDYGLLRLYGYLTWVANSDKLFMNIDDTNNGVDFNKIFETTIKYKEFEWTFSLANSDFEGHEGRDCDFPHFHFQMKKNGYVVIKFNDYHIPFSENDLIQFEMIHQDAMVIMPGYQSGINILKELPAEDLIQLLTRSESEEQGTFKTHTELLIPNDCVDEVKVKIAYFRNNTKMTVPQIVEYLNKEFGYGIKYRSINTPINPIYKSHRN